MKMAMNLTQCTLATTLLVAVSGCSAPMPAYEQPKSSLSIKPLTPEQQIAKEQETPSNKPVGIAPGSISLLPVPAKPIAPTLQIVPIWTLAAGRTIGQELQAWGVKAGWKVIWNMQKDWAVPAETSFPGDFPTAAGDVIKTLAANGALIRAQFFEGNKTLVVIGPGVTAQ